MAKDPSRFDPTRPCSFWATRTEPARRPCLPRPEPTRRPCLLRPVPKTSLTHHKSNGGSHHENMVSGGKISYPHTFFINLNRPRFSKLIRPDPAHFGRPEPTRPGDPIISETTDSTRPCDLVRADPADPPIRFFCATRPDRTRRPCSSEAICQP